jgi:hypothetical protein
MGLLRRRSQSRGSRGRGSGTGSGIEGAFPRGASGGTGALTEAVLDRPASAARRGFDRDAVRRRARKLGLAVEPGSADVHARALIGRLRRGARLDPQLASLLREQLAGRESAPVPDDLADAVEWLGASDHERGRALRDVLRLYDQIARSRGPVREPAAARFPRFEVRPERQAS